MKKSVLEAADVLAPAIFQLILLHNQSAGDIRPYLNRSVAWLVRELSIFFDVPTNVSLKASAKSGGQDMRALTWKKQSEIDPEREIFHYEHVVEVGAITEQLLKASSSAQVAKILKTLKIAWILKEENAALSKKDQERRKNGGPKRRSEAEWRETYRQAGIELIYDW